ncbi:hypothetical protein A2867_05035 [Candidatus Daviesbacteria bacterium RIFCSPHIGHO2_01_FULL_40_11]|uniref:Membrane protein insertion efficiency factor YidD n=1 Tax=Candidatus Daviesbacteria bacterium RIFCSPHIGHO2_01_FULL_40_11 TaxID=1797762 RepID=A0A1F5JI88_9BACT|nr:MAG: hypothetical protein A2867_05035 [Candidatus Daviesbacteria bacterium RIFCSPHIGHO2_01_FULL_40_11]
MKLILVKLINFYQTYLSFDGGVLAVFAPGGACKCNPSCSEYTKQKIVEFGVFRGSWLGLNRIWSCK